MKENCNKSGMKTKRGYYDLFIRTAAKYSSNVAVRFYHDGEYKHYSYSELYGACEYISQTLRLLNYNNNIVGLVCKRNILVPSLIAAVHKCSTTFMFMDPNNDIASIITNIKPSIVIVVDDNNSNKSIPICNKIPVKSLCIFDLRLYFYNFNWPDHQTSKKQELKHSFISMTSGSTGEPKHIQVPLQCIQPNINDLTNLFEITPKDIIYFSTPLTFDPSMIEILLACKNGASLLIAPETVDTLFPRNSNSITFWQTTPSKFFQHSNKDVAEKILSECSTLKILALGGEPLCGVKLLKETKHSMNKTKIFTLYGVTEMSCWACVAELDLKKIDSDQEIPLGQCLSETQLTLQPNDKDENLGSIVLSSQTRSCSILNQSISYVESGINNINTGDIAEIKNGAIYYRGRKDDVIKRFGHKVDLKQIELKAMQYSDIKSCSCIWLPKPLLLVLYFSSEICSSSELQAYLKTRLNEQQWPDKIIRVESLPTNNHGKTSKRILKDIFEKSTRKRTITNKRKYILNELKSILQCNLTYEDMKDKDFISIGGTSFMAVTICNKLSKTHPYLAKNILPMLLSPNHSISNIVDVVESSKIKRKIKRLISTVDTEVANKSFGSSSTISNEILEKEKHIEFVIAWNFDTGKCVDASPTLFKTDSKVYVTVGSHSGKIVVFDAESGSKLGVLTVNSRVEASALCFNNLVGVPCGVVGCYDGTVVCYKLDNADEVWRVNVKAMVKSKAALVRGTVYVACYDSNIRQINCKNGAIVKTLKIEEQAISADLVSTKHDYLLLGTLSGVCASINTKTNTVVWRSRVGSPIFASPVLYDDDKLVVYVEVNGEIHCFMVDKGIKIWQFQGSSGNIFSSIYIKPIKKYQWQMIYGSHDKKINSLIIENHQIKKHWSTEMQSPVYSTPCGFQEHVLAINTLGTLCVINMGSGQVMSRFNFPNEVFSSPTVYGKHIFIGCRNDQFYALQYKA